MIYVGVVLDHLIADFYPNPPGPRSCGPIFRTV
jgi:hypothetical protein